MAVWWSSLDLFQQMLYCIAIPATLLVIIQLILMCLGLGDGGADADASDFDLDLDMPHDLPDVDFDVDTDIDTDFDIHTDVSDVTHDGFDTDGSDASDAASVRLFTLQGILTFFCMFSWMALLLYRLSVPAAISLLGGFAVGFVAMYATAKAMQIVRHLNEEGNVRPENAVGKEAEVYLPIPANLGGEGKVMLEVQGRLSEWSAVTEEEESLQRGERVVVTGVQGTVLTVEKKGGHYEVTI